MAGLEHLLQLKQQNLTNDNLLSQLAFYYLVNPDGCEHCDNLTDDN